jgi:hypothetical protein
MALGTWVAVLLVGKVMLLLRLCWLPTAVISGKLVVCAAHAVAA